MARIAWVHTHMNYWGGAVRYVLELASRLSKEFDLTLFIGGDSPMTEKFISESGVRVVVEPSISTGSPWYWALMPLMNLRAARRLARLSSRFDLVIASYASANMIVTRVHPRVLYLCFDPFSLFYSKTEVNSLSVGPRLFWKVVGLLYRPFDTKATRSSARILTIDMFTADQISRLFGRAAVVVREGVDAGFFRPVNRVGAVFDRYSGRRVILSQTHGYSRSDGCEYLLSAVAELKSEFPNIVVLFTSMFRDEKRASYLRSLCKRLGIEQNAEFLGFVEERLLPSYYSVAEVVVQPSIDTNSKLVVKEAMACERPIVVFEGALSEDLGKDCAVVVPEKSITQLSESIAELLRSPDKARRMGKRGRTRALELYSWDAIFASVKREIGDVLKPQ